MSRHNKNNIRVHPLPLLCTKELQSIPRVGVCKLQLQPIDGARMKRSGVGSMFPSSIIQVFTLYFSVGLDVLEHCSGNNYPNHQSSEKEAFCFSSVTQFNHVVHNLIHIWTSNDQSALLVVDVLTNLRNVRN
jgi:predicted methyltransferase